MWHYFTTKCSKYNSSADIAVKDDDIQLENDIKDKPRKMDTCKTLSPFLMRDKETLTGSDTISHRSRRLRLMRGAEVS